MKLLANCKVNVGLRVRRLREDGYHDIETLFYPVMGLHDVLEIEYLKGMKNCQEIEFAQDGIMVDCANEENLVVRAYRQVAQAFPRVGSIRVHLRKQVPFGAGLGGGSSDAAHTVIGLNSLFDLHMTREQMAALVRPIGADCPFFIYNEPCFARGIGDELQPRDFSWSGKRMLMLKPDVHVSTREAYAGIEMHDEPWDWRVNDFEPTVFRLHPQLARAKQALLDAGAEYAAMSGSGSVIYGIFERDSKNGALPYRRFLDEEFASMVIFDDTL